MAKSQTQGVVPESITSSSRPEGSPVLMATSNTVRNLILPKLAAILDVQLAGLADTPENALKMLVQEHPEVVIFDMDFGGEFEGLDTARLMQKTRARAAIVMLVPELDVESMRRYARRFGSSWSYVKRSTAARVDVLESVLKSAIRGVQWIEPELSRPLSAIWKIAEQARDLEATKIEDPVAIHVSPRKLKSASFAEPASTKFDTQDLFDDDFDDENELAPGIKTKSTSDAGLDGLKISSVSIGHGGIGQGIRKVRRNRSA
ncbi:response regulator transcription factor [Dehalococcoides mccartyi]|nr:response regulator transcription factor [Dehalococcoides mccartyi]